MRNFDERRSAIAYFIAKGMSERDANAAVEGFPLGAEPHDFDAGDVEGLCEEGADLAEAQDHAAFEWMLRAIGVIKMLAAEVRRLRQEESHD